MAQHAREAEMIGFHQLCERGDRKACIRFGMLLGENRPLPAPFRTVAELGLRAIAAAETGPPSPVGAPSVSPLQSVSPRRPQPLAAALGIQGGRNAD